LTRNFFLKKHNSPIFDVKYGLNWKNPFKLNYNSNKLDFLSYRSRMFSNIKLSKNLYFKSKKINESVQRIFWIPQSFYTFSFGKLSFFSDKVNSNPTTSFIQSCNDISNSATVSADAFKLVSEVIKKKPTVLKNLSWEKPKLRSCRILEKLETANLETNYPCIRESGRVENNPSRFSDTSPSMVEADHRGPSKIFQLNRQGKVKNFDLGEGYFQTVTVKNTWNYFLKTCMFDSSFSKTSLYKNILGSEMKAFTGRPSLSGRFCTQDSASTLFFSAPPASSFVASQPLVPQRGVRGISTNNSEDAGKPFPVNRIQISTCIFGTNHFNNSLNMDFDSSFIKNLSDINGLLKNLLSYTRDCQNQENKKNLLKKLRKRRKSLIDSPLSIVNMLPAARWSSFLLLHPLHRHTPPLHPRGRGCSPFGGYGKDFRGCSPSPEGGRGCREEKANPPFGDEPLTIEAEGFRRQRGFYLSGSQTLAKNSQFFEKLKPYYLNDRDNTNGCPHKTLKSFSKIISFPYFLNKESSLFLSSNNFSQPLKDSSFFLPKKGYFSKKTACILPLTPPLDSRGLFFSAPPAQTYAPPASSGASMSVQPPPLWGMGVWERLPSMSVQPTPLGGMGDLIARKEKSSRPRPLPPSILNPPSLKVRGVRVRGEDAAPAKYKSSLQSIPVYNKSQMSLFNFNFYSFFNKKILLSPEHAGTSISGCIQEQTFADGQTTACILAPKGGFSFLAPPGVGAGKKSDAAKSSEDLVEDCGSSPKGGFGTDHRGAASPFGGRGAAGKSSKFFVGKTLKTAKNLSNILVSKTEKKIGRKSHITTAKKKIAKFGLDTTQICSPYLKNQLKYLFSLVGTYKVSTQKGSSPILNNNAKHQYLKTVDKTFKILSLNNLLSNLSFLTNPSNINFIYKKGFFYFELRGFEPIFAPAKTPQGNLLPSEAFDGKSSASSPKGGRAACILNPPSLKGRGCILDHTPRRGAYVCAGGGSGVILDAAGIFKNYSFISANENILSGLCTQPIIKQRKKNLQFWLKKSTFFKKNYLKAIFNLNKRLYSYLFSFSPPSKRRGGYRGWLHSDKSHVFDSRKNFARMSNQKKLTLKKRMLEILIHKKCAPFFVEKKEKSVARTLKKPLQNLDTKKRDYFKRKASKASASQIREQPSEGSKQPINFVIKPGWPYFTNYISNYLKYNQKLIQPGKVIGNELIFDRESIFLEIIPFNEVISLLTLNDNLSKSYFSYKPYALLLNYNLEQTLAGFSFLAPPAQTYAPPASSGASMSVQPPPLWGMGVWERLPSMSVQPPPLWGMGRKGKQNNRMQGAGGIKIGADNVGAMVIQKESNFWVTKSVIKNKKCRYYNENIEKSNNLTACVEATVSSSVFLAGCPINSFFEQSNDHRFFILFRSASEYKVIKDSEYKKEIHKIANKKTNTPISLHRSTSSPSPEGGGAAQTYSEVFPIPPEGGRMSVQGGFGASMVGTEPPFGGRGAFSFLQSDNKAPPRRGFIRLQEKKSHRGTCFSKSSVSNNFRFASNKTFNTINLFSQFKTELLNKQKIASQTISKFPVSSLQVFSNSSFYSSFVILKQKLINDSLKATMLQGALISGLTFQSLHPRNSYLPPASSPEPPLPEREGGFRMQPVRELGATKGKYFPRMQGADAGGRKQTPISEIKARVFKTSLVLENKIVSALKFLPISIYREAPITAISSINLSPLIISSKFPYAFDFLFKIPMRFFSEQYNLKLIFNNNNTPPLHTRSRGKDFPAWSGSLSPTQTFEGPASSQRLSITPEGATQTYSPPPAQTYAPLRGVWERLPSMSVQGKDFRGGGTGNTFAFTKFHPIKKFLNNYLFKIHNLKKFKELTIGTASDNPKSFGLRTTLPSMLNLAPRWSVPTIEAQDLASSEKLYPRMQGLLKVKNNLIDILNLYKVTPILSSFFYCPLAEYSLGTNFDKSLLYPNNLTTTNFFPGGCQNTNFATTLDPYCKSNVNNVYNKNFLQLAKKYSFSLSNRKIGFVLGSLNNFLDFRFKYRINKEIFYYKTEFESFRNNQISSLATDSFINTYTYCSFEGEFIFGKSSGGQYIQGSATKNKDKKIFEIVEQDIHNLENALFVNKRLIDSCMILTKKDQISYYLKNNNDRSIEKNLGETVQNFSLYNNELKFDTKHYAPFLRVLEARVLPIFDRIKDKDKNKDKDKDISLNNISYVRKKTKDLNYKEIYFSLENLKKKNQYLINDTVIKFLNILDSKEDSDLSLLMNKIKPDNNQSFSNSKPLNDFSEFNFKINKVPMGISQQTNRLLLGELLVYGDQISSDFSITKPGQIIHINNNKITIRKGQPIFVSPKAILHKYDTDFIEEQSPVITLSYQQLKTGDIIEGIPKVEQFFEARTTKRGRLFRDSLSNLLKGLFKRYCSKGQPLDQAVRQSFYKIQQIIVDGVQRVYRSQGVSIADKHLEVIVKQMTSKVRIIEGGQTGFFPGEIVDLNVVEEVNSLLMRKISYEPLVLGITKASLEVDSFLSAASFQQTTRVLSNAAISKKKDFLKGLKENVILGNLIPAGTGYLVYLIP
jgi:hypothetical protein